MMRSNAEIRARLEREMEEAKKEWTAAHKSSDWRRAEAALRKHHGAMVKKWRLEG